LLELPYLFDNILVLYQGIQFGRPSIGDTLPHMRIQLHGVLLWGVVVGGPS